MMMLSPLKIASRRVGVLLMLAVLAALPAQAQKRDVPSALFKRAAQPTTPGDGYMVAGEYWNTIKPMNSDEANGVEDPNRDIGALHWINLGPDGTGWLEPGGMWPGGNPYANYWRDGTRIVFPVFEADGWTNPLQADEATPGTEYMFAYYTPNVPGADDPARNYKAPAHFTDDTRTHLVYEAGWPTTAGIDFKMRAHQYTINEQNLNDFVVVEITMTNTGVVDANGDGTPEETNHTIDAVSAAAWAIPSITVFVTETGGRSNRFGAGRTFGYLGVPESGNENPMLLWYANVPPSRTTGRTAPAPGQRLIGVNDANRLRGYTDVWSGVAWLGARQGSVDGSLVGAPPKETIFGTHPVGADAQRGWYTSATNQDPSLFNLNRPDLAFYSSTATWYEDYGRTTTFDTRKLGPNPAFFSAGTAGDITTFVPRGTGVRPNGDFKYASEDISPAEGIAQPVWEDVLNPTASSGNFYDGAIGFTKEFTFGEEVNYGVGPFGLAVGESMTIAFVVAGGFRYEGISDAVTAARWAWDQGWDVSASLPVPPAPEIRVESTTNGTARIRWTDVTGVGPNVDGYKIWRAAQYRRESWFPSQEEGANGFALMDGYQHLHEPGGDIRQFADPGNPYFDAFDEFKGATQNFYQPSEWGPYELIAKIPLAEVSQYNDAGDGYAFSFEDEDAITGFTYWYYVSAYTEGSFTGPLGPIEAQHIESSNFNRNGRNSPDAPDGVLGDVAPWGSAFPFAIRATDYPDPGTQQHKNIGAPFTVTPPVAPVDQVADLITVSPNPYKITGLNDQRDNASSHMINFLNTPANYEITIVDVSGQIIFQEEVENATNGKFTWDMFSKDGIEVASGLYVYHISYGDGREVVGHFSILR